MHATNCRVSILRGAERGGGGGIITRLFIFANMITKSPLHSLTKLMHCAVYGLPGCHVGRHTIWHTTYCRLHLKRIGTSNFVVLLRCL